MNASLRESPSDSVFLARLRNFGVEEVGPQSLLDQLSADLLRGFSVALDCAFRHVDRVPALTHAWLQREIKSLSTTQASDDLRSRAAEVEATLRLTWLGPVERLKATKSERRPDLRVEELNVEIYCPQEHTDERLVVETDLAQQLEAADGRVRVAVAISHPATGSGRKVDENGNIRRDPANKALTYPANKLIDRILHKKRDGGQFLDGGLNVLWLDLKHGLGLSSADCVPLRSVIAKGTCFTGAAGIWHGFFGETGSPHLGERTALEWPICPPTYDQVKCGWFRELPKVSAVILSTLDGVLFFENPWARTPVADAQRRNVFRLSELRPELSWSDCAGTLREDVESTLARLSWLARLARDE